MDIANMTTVKCL